VNVWTVNAPGDLQAMVGLGVDTVITDRVTDALEATRAGGAGGSEAGDAGGTRQERRA
jgi:hypothetical protein